MIFSRFRQSFNDLTNKAKELTKKIVSHSSRDSEPPKVIVDNKNEIVKKNSFEFSYAKFSATFWLYGAILLLVVFVLYKAFPIVTLILASYIISVAIEGPVRFVRKSGLGRGPAMFVCYLLVVFLILAILMVVPFVAIQLGELMSNLVNYVAGVQQTIQSIGRVEFIRTANFLPGYFRESLLGALQDPAFVSQLQASLTQLVGTGQSMISNITGFALKTATSFFNIISRVMIVIAMSVFFSIEKDSVLTFVVDLLSKQNNNKEYVYNRVVTLYSKLQLWLKGQLFLMLYVGSFVFVGLSVLGFLGIDIPQKRLLALMAGVTEIIPYIGPILGGIPAFLVATLSFGVWGGVGVLVIFAIVQWTENNIVVPVVMNKVLGINPLLIFICILMGGWVLGFIGMILAVPIAVILTVLFDRTYK